MKKTAKRPRCSLCVSENSVAQIDTALVPSFTLLPVSLFPVYLAVIFFHQSVMV